MNIDNTLLQKYAPVIASALVLVLPAVDILSKNPSPIAILQFIILIATTFTTYQFKAPIKQIIEVVGVIATAVLPLAITGEVTWANWAVVAVAVVKALATHLGVVIRKDEEVATPTVAAVTTAAPSVVVTSLPSAALPEDDAIVQNDGLKKDVGGNSNPGVADHSA